MSNIAGKAYAMNAITPMRWYTSWLNRLFFWASSVYTPFLSGLLTLSLIHYARWVIVKPSQFPNMGHGQPTEELRYNYMFFFSNFNGSWDQYVDSFSSAIPSGLDLFWKRNIQYPGSVPMLPFHHYITRNQIWTDHYYNAYPMASSNDVKSARRVKQALLTFIDDVKADSPAAFQQKYNRLLLGLQHDISQMGPNPVISLAARAVEQRLRREEGRPDLPAQAESISYGQ
jgi:hypothetical protein